MGRKRKSPVVRYQAIAWYRTVANWFGDDSPSRLEREFQPHLVRKNSDGRWVYSRSWTKYQKGIRLPSGGNRKDGKPYALTATEHVPGTSDIYRHLIWRILRQEKISVEMMVEILACFPVRVARLYIDPTSDTMDDLFESLAENIGFPIWIDVDDPPQVSLDHLAIHLMILKMDNFRLTRVCLEGIANNIAKTLGPLASSVWFNEIYDEFFDFLEISVWRDLFDKHYQCLGSSRGWRRTKLDWIKSNCY